MFRPRSFDAPHKGLRNALAQFSVKSANTDFSDLAQVEDLYSLGRELFSMLTIHAHDENDVPLTQLEGRATGSSTHNLEEHERLEKIQQEVEDLLEETLNTARRGENAAVAGLQLYTRFTGFYSEYLNHMLEEETETQQLLWDHFSDEELRGHSLEIISKMPPQMLLTWMKYIIPASNPSERKMMLGGLKAAVPPAFFAQVMQVLEQVLPQPALIQLNEALAEAGSPSL